MTSSDSVDGLTRSVSDGSPVDWEHVELGTDLDANTVDAMRDVARIAEFNRVLQRTQETLTPEQQLLGTTGAPLQRWRDLTLLEPLGTGTRGEVWRAWDSTLQRQVALKFLLPASSKPNSDVSGDLLNEARALARVRHPSIVTVHGIAEHEGRIGMWMECVPGISLAREIERTGALPPQRVARIALQLCAALGALETAGVVHRDIKPGNILLEGEDRAVLTDFGLGWRLDLDHDDAPFKSSGTPIFMAPEVLAGGRPSHQSDLYSLGVTLWWALAGEAPFDATSLGELKRQAEQGPARRLQSLQPPVPADLVDAILRAMNPAASKRPRSASELAAGLIAAANPHPSSLQEPRAASIAVLPFVNRNPGGEDEYFSDGLADELIAMLGKIRGLRVAARTSAFMFRARQATIGEIGRALNVETVLDGSIRRSGERIRIAVQLISVGDGLHLWSENYDRTLDDVFAVQDDIARSAVRELRAALQGAGASVSEEVQGEVARAAKGRTSNPEAHRLYLQARHFVDRFNRLEMARAIAFLNEALALDPNFAHAWAELARAYAAEADAGWVPAVAAYEQSREAAKRALDLEPGLAEGHVRMGRIQRNFDRDWPNAKASYARAVELDPGNAVVLSGAGALDMNLGRFEEAIELYQRALDRDPLNAGTYHNMGIPLLYAGRLAEAEAAFRRALELAPQTVGTRCFLSWTLSAQGRGDEALAEAMNEPEKWIRLWALTALHHAAGRAAESDKALRELEEEFSEYATFQIAEAHALRAEVDEAFQWLERAHALRDSGLSDLKASPRLRSLHGDPRWRVMLLKMGFEGVATP